MQLFISYARTDRPKADPLSQRLRQAGNDVWLDIDLSGGQVWWDNILHQIRQSDAFIAVVSRSSLKSQACMIERQYAARLGKPILPLTVEPLNSETLPSDISRLEIVDYAQPDETAAFRLIGAISRLPPAPPMPVPLPEPPEAPSSYWGNIGDQVNAPSLNFDQQLAIIGRIEGAFAPTADSAERPIALDLLSQLERRTDLYAAVDRRIALLKRSGSEGAAGAGGPGAGGPGADWSGSTPEDDHITGRVKGTRTGDGAGSTGSGSTGSGSTGSWDSGNSGKRKSSGNQAPRTTGASSHWILAILALVCFWPTGIASIVYASRVKPQVAGNDLAAAQKSSSRVVLFFWISVGLLVLSFIAVAATSGSSTSDSAGAAIHSSQVVAVSG